MLCCARVCRLQPPVGTLGHRTNKRGGVHRWTHTGGAAETHSLRKLDTPDPREARGHEHSTVLMQLGKTHVCPGTHRHSKQVRSPHGNGVVHASATPACARAQRAAGDAWSCSMQIPAHSSRQADAMEGSFGAYVEPPLYNGCRPRGMHGAAPTRPSVLSHRECESWPVGSSAEGHMAGVCCVLRSWPPPGPSSAGRRSGSARPPPSSRAHADSSDTVTAVAAATAAAVAALLMKRPFTRGRESA